MTRSTARRLAPIAVVALALLAGGCSSDDSTDTSASPAASAAASASEALCSGFASLKTDAADLTSTKVDTSKTADEVQQQIDDLQGKADKVRDDLNTMMMESQGGPAAAVIGALNQKADALRRAADHRQDRRPGRPRPEDHGRPAGDRRGDRAGDRRRGQALPHELNHPPGRSTR